jgi:hypothetical protein
VYEELEESSPNWSFAAANAFRSLSVLSLIGSRFHMDHLRESLAASAGNLVSKGPSWRDGMKAFRQA